MVINNGIGQDYERIVVLFEYLFRDWSKLYEVIIQVLVRVLRHELGVH